jgi:hypothetical protein
MKYKTPQLKRLGSLAELTLGTSPTPQNDTMSPGGNKPNPN